MPKTKKTQNDDIKDSTNKKQIYLFFGEEAYDIQKAIEKIKKSFDILKDNINFFELNKENITTLYDICQNVTFLGDKKLVIIKDTNLKFDIDKMYNSMTDETIVCIIEQTIDKRTSEYKKLSKIANIQEFNHLNLEDMTKYIAGILSKYNLKIIKANAEYFVNVCGDDKQNDLNELQKLVIYSNSQTDVITKDMIDKVCSKTLNAKIFDMLDKAVNKNSYGAIKDLDDLLMQKEPIVKIYIMLYRQIIQMYMIKILKNKNSQNISQVLKIHPFVLRKLSYSCDKYTLDSLKNIIYLFDEYDEKTKQGDMDFVIGLKKIICQM